jgi:hypothetical protein
VENAERDDPLPVDEIRATNRFLVDAYQAAVWIYNRTPTKTARGWMTPYEFIHGEAPDI